MGRGWCSAMRKCAGLIVLIIYSWGLCMLLSISVKYCHCRWFICRKNPLVVTGQKRFICCIPSKISLLLFTQLSVHSQRLSMVRYTTQYCHWNSTPAGFQPSPIQHLPVGSRYATSCPLCLFLVQVWRDRSTTHPKFHPNQGSNSWSPDHDSTLHVTETSLSAVTCHKYCSGEWCLPLYLKFYVSPISIP